MLPSCVLIGLASCARGTEISNGADPADEPAGTATAALEAPEAPGSGTTGVTVLGPAAAPSPESLRDGEDWPWFLGPRHDGSSAESGLVEPWPESGLPLVWEQGVGTGYSAPSVRGGRLVVHHRQGRQEIVDCRRADNGELLWSHAYGSSFKDPYGYNNGPRCSPVLSETHCYTFGAQGKLLCLQLETGDVVWQRDLLTEMTIPDGFFGVGATPILEGDRLIVAAGGQPNAGVIAVDAATGKTLWESVGQATWDGAKTDSRLRPIYEWTGDEMVVSYSSPIAATIHGKRHILVLMRHGLVSLDPQTGAENFHYWFRADVHESVNAARPVVVDDTIMISAAYQAGAARLQVAPDGKSVTELWRDRRNLLTHWSTSIYRDGRYYGFSGRHDHEATLRCLDAETGDVVWETDGWGRPFTDLRQTGRDEFLDLVSEQKIPTPFYGRGSKIMIGDRFLALSEYGLLALIPINPEKWEEISRFKPPHLKYPTWAAPVLSRGYLYLRSEDWLLCYDLRPIVSE
ncbi:MAG: PQQ-binding-like beta-propeller repeat protein [Planctomycetaceae bacterium]|nr:PQQ-binding-like beta-propeller repeat protein [Planctomycetaceae bacterium]